MRYKVCVIEKTFYEWTIDAVSSEEAKYLVKQLFHLTEEREETFRHREQVIFASIQET